MSTANHRILRASVFFAFAAILYLSGCQADRIEAERSFRSQNLALTIQASYEQPDVDTKTVRV